ncbi:helicase HerA domain-containing protein [Acinetobacter guillouiae]|uniref:helicase HerA domain-containing protein n=1 Tax=Acinetobacter guillouiae TaxID=106649 RepID=UPI00300A4D32
MQDFLTKSRFSSNPLSALNQFLDEEKTKELVSNTDNWRFAGYVIDIGFNTVRIITSDPYKKAIGGMPRGSFLIMVPEDLEGIAPHFSLLRVSGVAPTPLTNSIQQTYFELHKKSMPELDRWTISELQWGSIDCDLLGMFYPNPNNAQEIEFSGDINAVVSAHRYRVYAPDERILSIIINGMVKSELNQSIGKLRLTECRLPFNNTKSTVPDVEIQISLKDFLGARTAMFGKTRLGKSNVVKIIANATIEALTQQNEYKCGQLIFDINGEYANTNHQNKSLKEIHPFKLHSLCITSKT